MGQLKSLRMPLLEVEEVVVKRQRGELNMVGLNQEYEVDRSKSVSLGLDLGSGVIAF